MNFFHNHRHLIIGILAGAISGYLYYHFVGCDGQCLISSSPVISALYGALLGGFAANLFQKKKVSEGTN